MSTTYFITLAYDNFVLLMIKGKILFVMYGAVVRLQRGI